MLSINSKAILKWHPFNFLAKTTTQRANTNLNLSIHSTYTHTHCKRLIILIKVLTISKTRTKKSQRQQQHERSILANTLQTILIIGIYCEMSSLSIRCNQFKLAINLNKIYCLHWNFTHSTGIRRKI